MSLFRIGLTGGIGSGKTAASDCFEECGIKVVDADIVAREVVEPGSPALSEISKHFGDDILDEAGWLDRKKLRSLIFKDKQQKGWLEALLHPIIRAEIANQLSNSTTPYSVLVSPLLFETDQHVLVDRTLLIDVPVELQIERASYRDNADPDQIRAIIAQQMPRECKIEKADDIILNDTDLQSLRSKVQRIHHLYLELAHEHLSSSR
ncbi:MAG: dephospho-CoA kinase [Oleiphilus sp.]|nr:MAG: dephospho-CoA kinase [Oleiphilus sp.]